MIAYLLLNDWIFVAVLVLMFVVASFIWYWVGVSRGFTSAFATVKFCRWLDATFVKCNDGQYRSLSTVQENMGTNELCNFYNACRMLANGVISQKRLAEIFMNMTEEVIHG